MIKMTMGQLRWHGRELMESARESSADAVTKCAALVEAAAKKSLRIGAFAGVGPRGGKKMVPSTPPAPPHARTRTLLQSVGWAREGDSAIVGPTARSRGYPYGRLHEFGSEAGGRHYPKRPYMRPALMGQRHKFPRLFAQMRLKGGR